MLPREFWPLMHPVPLKSGAVDSAGTGTKSGRGLGDGGRTLGRKPRRLFSPVTCPAPPSDGKCVSEEAAGWGRAGGAWVTACRGGPRGAGCAGVGGQGQGCWGRVQALPFLSGSHFLSSALRTSDKTFTSRRTGSPSYESCPQALPPRPLWPCQCSAQSFIQ